MHRTVEIAQRSGRFCGKPPDGYGKVLFSPSWIGLYAVFVVIILVDLPLRANCEAGNDGPVLCEPDCLNNGTCALDPLTQLPTCVCPIAEAENEIYYRGAFCQTEAVKCNETWWCENGGSCLDVSEQGEVEQQFNCSCPASFEGLKCQNPVASCGDGLWCANGGTCDMNVETNETICKCPSTHTGVNCQTLVEAQELGGLPAAGGLDGGVLPASDGYAVDSTEDEREKYFRLFFWVLAALLVVWALALLAVHWTKIRPHLRTKTGHMRMGPLNLKMSEPHTDGPDVEDPINPHTPAGTPAGLPGGSSAATNGFAEVKKGPAGPVESTDSKAELELVPAFSGSLEAEVESARLQNSRVPVEAQRR